jgi:glyoxylase-like metal-dependent hydrolase (beta-lactamase superfamily II)/rhodanese-related sulfurtransferase
MNQITPAELVRELETGASLAVVDIRESEEYDGWHIHGSKNLPVYDALNRGALQALTERTGALPTDRTIVAVCRRGNTSLRAVQVLERLGFRAVNLKGGMRGWSGVWTEAPIPLENGIDASLVQIRRNGKGCLSYLFAAGGEAAVVDPCVAISAYQDVAKRFGARITTVLETHVHADHLSRAGALAEATGATLILPRNRRVVFPYTPAEDGQEIRVGALALTVIATPGHTEESVCYRLPGGVLLTGDTLFVGSVGRPDLEKGDAGADRGARSLYQSLKRLLAPGAEARYYPGHESRAIGFDGHPIGSTLSQARAELKQLEQDQDAFAAAIVRSLSAKPPNYEQIVAVNEGKADLAGADPLDLEAGPNRCAAG